MGAKLPREFVFFVPGKVQPGGSKLGFVVSGHVNIVDSNKKAKPWKEEVKKAAKKCWPCPGRLFEGALKIRCRFILKRPKSHYRSGKYSHLLKDTAPRYPTVKPDATKLLRPLEDALTGVVYRDDALIVTQLIKKRYGKKPGAFVTVIRVSNRRIIKESICKT